MAAIRKIILLLIDLGMLTFVFILLCYAKVANNAKGETFTNPSEIPFHKVGLLLGTSPTLSNGTENLYFTYRIDATVDLFNQGKIAAVLISGDNGRHYYNEPLEMKSALVAKGIPDSVIYLDYAGFRTFDSVIRCKEIFGQTDITVISQKFHNERAIYIAGKYGIKVHGFNARNVDAYSGFKTNVREYFARIKLFIDLLVGRQPKFLGEKIEIK